MIHKRLRNLVLAFSLLLMSGGACFSDWRPFALGWVLVNGYAFAVMAWDKHSAKSGGFRLPQASLLMVAAFGGGFGCALGMLACRHKTRHASFLVLVPLFCAFQLLLLFGWIKEKIAW